MRRFHLDRHVDVSGVSGTGRVAEGVLFEHTGQLVMCWLTECSSIAVYQSVDDLERIHLHDGKTSLVWQD